MSTDRCWWRDRIRVWDSRIARLMLRAALIAAVTVSVSSWTDATLREVSAAPESLASEDSRPDLSGRDEFRFLNASSRVDSSLVCRDRCRWPARQSKTDEANPGLSGFQRTGSSLDGLLLVFSVNGIGEHLPVNSEKSDQ